MELQKFDLSIKAIFRRKLIHYINLPIRFSIYNATHVVSFIDKELYGLGKLNDRFQAESQIKSYERSNNIVIGSLRDMFLYNRYKQSFLRTCDCCGKPIIKQVGLCKTCEDDLHNKLNFIIRRIKQSY